jgi:hypothetical protein
MLKAYGLLLLLLASPAVAQEAAAQATAPQGVATGESVPQDLAAQTGVDLLQPGTAMKSPRLTSFTPDWNAARAAIDPASVAAPPNSSEGTPARDLLERLDESTGRLFPDIAASPVPVLLPVEPAASSQETAASNATTAPASAAEVASADKSTPGFRSTLFFAGPAGYDAVFAVQGEDDGERREALSTHAQVQISGFAFVYELDGPQRSEGAPAPELKSKFPGIRRLLLENRLRYTFMRFGIPYVVSIQCTDGRRRRHWLSCRKADKLARRFLQELSVAGGSPQAEAAAPAEPPVIQRPDKLSPDFTYYAPGDILPGTGIRGQDGRADATVYGNIRFPMATAPAYVNSQSFGNWGNCDLTGRVRLGGRGKDATYRCRVNGIPLVHNEAKNYAYPWRDNFCEHRHYNVSQCPAGVGHQGEDIRPDSCKLRNKAADRCLPYQHEVVAASDGMVLRSPRDEALYILVNRPGEHVRVRYLHMNPRLLDAAGMVSGRKLAEGDVIGLVDDYDERQGGTTYHLHFNLQVPTRQGWVFVNPYMTLVAAYEYMIGGRGRLVSDATLAASAAASPASPGTMPSIQPISDANSAPGTNDNTHHEVDGERRTAAVACATRLVEGLRRRFCQHAHIEPGRRDRPVHAHAVRTMDRGVSQQGHGARHYRKDQHARDERNRAGHGRS